MRLLDCFVTSAGLDSFAWRRPDLLSPLTVFEVDHAASQVWKLERVRDLGLPINASQAFVPVDSGANSVQEVLGTASFDWARPAMFCWTGVAPLPPPTAQAIESTLHTIAAAAPGLTTAAPATGREPTGGGQADRRGGRQPRYETAATPIASRINAPVATSITSVYTLPTTTGRPGGVSSVILPCTVTTHTSRFGAMSGSGPIR